MEIIMIIKINSYVIRGLDSIPTTVEVSVVPGLAKFEIIGLADIATKESRERVMKSITGLGYRVPPGNITINLSPAKIKKKGTLYDLPIAMGILMASGQITQPDNLEKFLIVGELSLDGKVREVPGLFITALQNYYEEKNNQYYLIPELNYQEMRVFSDLEKNILPINDLGEAVEMVNQPIPRIPMIPEIDHPSPKSEEKDFREVMGNNTAKLALQLAVIHRLNILFIGPPGGGKSMLINRVPTILPPLSQKESLEVTKIHQIKGITHEENILIETLPFRSVHNSIHPSSLIGGGKFPEPGEVSLAHHGFLFLDELSEFNKLTLQCLRIPLEEKQITINRMEGQVTFPCNFTLLACTNPCPCGYYGDDTKMCSCSRSMMSRFYSKLSGPILDRFDIIIFINGFDRKNFQSQKILDSATMKKNIQNAILRKSEYPYPFKGITLKEIFKTQPLFEELILRSVEKKLFSLRKVKSILKTIYALELLHKKTADRELLLTAIDLCRNKVKLDL